MIDLRPGARAALAAAHPETGIILPPAEPFPYRSTHLAELCNHQIIFQHHRRCDGLWVYALTQKGRELIEGGIS